MAKNDLLQQSIAAAHTLCEHEDYLNRLAMQERRAMLSQAALAEDIRRHGPWIAAAN